MAKRKRGRPRKLKQPTARETLLQTLRDGGSRNDACGMAGLTAQTMLNEIERDAEFAAEVTRAELEGKMHCIREVKIKKPEFLLARKWWKEFGSRRPDQVSTARVLEIIVPIFTELVQKVPEADRQWCVDRIEVLIERLRLAGGASEDG